jgi:hypothetical protein
MRLNGRLRVGFALLFALLLPLQGYAAMPVCREAALASPAQQTQCAGVHAVHHLAVHHHNCDNCCCGAAMVLSPADFIAPLRAAPGISDAALCPPPTVALDRLDRPPRL